MTDESERAMSPDPASASLSRVNRVLVAEDEQLMRHALRVFLRGADDLELVDMVDNGAKAVEAAARLRPDVVLMDIHMPVMDGIEATRLITEASPATHVIALTTLGSVEAAVPMLRAGARGYLLKDCDPATLVASIRQVLGGDPALSPSVTLSLLQAVASGRSMDDRDFASHPATEIPSLTPADHDALQLLAAGLNTVEIAARLKLAEATVKSRMARLCAKFEVDSRVRLLIKVADLGLVRPRLDQA